MKKIAGGAEHRTARVEPEQHPGQCEVAEPIGGAQLDGRAVVDRGQGAA
ncbi:hypothetical protein LWP59_25245 [Amycolatopsis acidiphila]|nr:hypothetical protein [Amycolatopsis acidiphila]UIJ64210.1 hypothetical protein LWP59_25245 [Amycolatopsis acidiphila]